MLNFEAFSLLFHIFEEDAEVGWNTIVAFQILDVVPLIEFLAELFAHRLDCGDGVWELDVRFACILKSDWAKHFKLLILALHVSLFLFLLDFDALLHFAVRDAIQLFQFLLETSQVQRIVTN